MNSELLVQKRNLSQHADLDADYVRARLQQAIEQLPAKQKTVFCLRYFEEQSYQAMSDLLGTSVGALKASYHHAVRKVEAALRL
ncbi:MAG: sigma-70 family RNA polymerase sigma factor [Bacteroidota bacterium]